MSQDCRARRLWTRQCCPSLMGAEALVTQFNPRNVGNVSGTAYGRPKREFHLQFHRIGFGPADYDWAPHQLRGIYHQRGGNRTSFSQKPFRYPVGIFWSSRRCGTSSNGVGCYRSGRICFKKAITRSLGRHKPYRTPDPEIAQNRVTFL